MSFSEIIFEQRGGVGVITLNRPERMNAWTPTMEAEFRAALTDAADKPDIRAVVVTGAGRGFCGGADMSSLGEAASGADVRAALDFPRTGAQGLDANFDERFSYMLRFPKPLIAAINGPVVGVGLCVALFCDLRFIAEEAKVTTIFAERGLIAEHGAAWMLPRLIGPMNAFTLLYSCKAITGAEAMELGLARAYPAERLMEEVMALAESVAARSSPRSLRIIKQQVYDSMFQDLAESAQIGDREMFASFESDDFKEGVAHFVEKRPAHFSGG